MRKIHLAALPNYLIASAELSEKTQKLKEHHCKGKIIVPEMDLSVDYKEDNLWRRGPSIQFNLLRLNPANREALREFSFNMDPAACRRQITLDYLNKAGEPLLVIEDGKIVKNRTLTIGS